MTKGAHPYFGITPRVLRRERAAAYLDMSPNHFDRMVKEGIIPPPKLLGAIKGWDRADLDTLADQAPYASPANAPAGDWD